MYEYSSKVEHVLDGDTIEVTVDLGFHAYAKIPKWMVKESNPDTKEVTLDFGFRMFTKLTGCMVRDNSDEATIELGMRMYTTMPVRLFGINAPEIHSKSDTEKAHGLKAKAKLEELVSGKTVKIQSAKPNAQGGGDKFGRWLAIVWLTDGLQEKSVNQQLVELGLCKPWDGSGKKPI